MKKIIDELVYDTEKANVIGSYSKGWYGDSNAWDATLYITKVSKRYFVAGLSNLITRYAQFGQIPGLKIQEETVIPMTKEEAFIWAERFLSKEEVEAAFGNIQDA
jgi:hypothetical protein